MVVEKFLMPSREISVFSETSKTRSCTQKIMLIIKKISICGQKFRKDLKKGKTIRNFKSDMSLSLLVIS